MQLADDWSSASSSHPRPSHSMSGSKKSRKRDQAFINAGLHIAKGSASVVKCHCCDNDTTTCRQIAVYDYLSRADQFPVMQCYLKCPYYNGWVDALHTPIKFTTALIRDIPRAYKTDNPGCCPDASNVSTNIPLYQEQEHCPLFDAVAVIQAPTTLSHDVTSQPITEQMCAVQPCGGVACM